MAKLQTSSKSGFNAGDSYNVKYIQIDKIILDPEISKKFKLSEDVVEAISQSIIKDGFHKEEPVALWAEKNILLDGHQRYTAAKKAGLVEIPFIEKHFACLEDAILYTFERQAIRRNLTADEVLYAAKMIPDKKNGNGEGRAAEEWAKRLKVHVSTIYRAKSVIKTASEEDIQSIRDGKTSIKKVYNKNKQPQEVKFFENDSQSFPDNISFLRAVIIHLIESKQTTAAESLIKHFLKKNEKRGFYDTLPESISAQLPRLPLVAGRLIDP
jgi:ParB family chromosome partitioning protein